MSSSLRGLVVGLLMLVTAIAFEAQAVTTAMPAAAADLAGVALYAWAFTAFSIAQILAIVIAGRLCDRSGPVPPLVGGLALFGAGLVIAALAPAMPVLLVGRFVQGLGGGSVNLALMVTVGKVFDPADQARVMTWFSAAWMLPSFIGPAAAGWLTETLSWHAVFWGIVPFVLLGAAFLFPALRRTPIPLHREEDGPAPVGLGAAVLVSVGITLLQVAGQQLTWLSAVLAAAGLGLLVVGMPRLMPAGYGPLAPGMAAVINVRLLTGGAFMAGESFLPLMLVQLRGLSLVQAGMVVTIASVGWVVGSWVQARPWLRLRRDEIITLGAACVAAGMALIAAGSWWPSLWLGVVVGGATIAGAGMGLQTASTSLAVMLLSEPAQLGRNTSSLQVGEAIGMSLLGAVAGTLFAFFHGLGLDVPAFGAPMSVLVVVIVAAVVVSRRVGPVQNHTAQQLLPDP
ncbi:MFS transporter [Nigerium massiliense]|uniref:MFS transporter n=1 Tax=Nigerium massiliense TaxID=1522317 RepID=UPI000694873D|nr:MFS transporter [Nigerium massiliense]